MYALLSRLTQFRTLTFKMPAVTPLQFMTWGYKCRPPPTRTHWIYGRPRPTRSVFNFVLSVCVPWAIQMHTLDRKSDI